MKGMILLANGFEDMEMITTLDLLRRASIEVYTFAVKDEKRILSQSIKKVKSKKRIFSLKPPSTSNPIFSYSAAN